MTTNRKAREKRKRRKLFKTALKKLRYFSEMKGDSTYFMDGVKEKIDYYENQLKRM